MNFHKAVGKKVRNKITGEIRIVNSYSVQPSIILVKEEDKSDWIGFADGSLISKDWEIVKEKKTLSDYIIVTTNNLDKNCINHPNVIPVKCVKASLKEFIDWLNNPDKEINLDNTCKGKTPIEIQAKEIFGEELIK